MLLLLHALACFYVSPNKDTQGSLCANCTACFHKKRAFLSNGVEILAPIMLINKYLVFDAFVLFLAFSEVT